MVVAAAARRCRPPRRAPAPPRGNARGAGVGGSPPGRRAGGDDSVRRRRRRPRRWGVVVLRFGDPLDGVNRDGGKSSRGGGLRRRNPASSSAHVSDGVVGIGIGGGVGGLFLPAATTVRPKRLWPLCPPPSSASPFSVAGGGFGSGGVVGARAFSSSGTIPSNSPSRALDLDLERYRRLSVPPRSPTDAAVLEEYRSDTLQTLSAIDTELRKSRWGMGVDDVRQELERAAAVRAENAGAAAPEIGPAGRYLYEAEDIGLTGRRVFRRFSVAATERRSAESDDESAAVDEGTSRLGVVGREVFSVNFQLEELGPVSLSVDEEYVAYATTSLLSESRPTRITVRHIDSGEDFIVRTPDGLERRARTVEFGPVSADGSHSLFFTTANDHGRPDSVYRCFFDGSKGFSAPELIFRDENEAHFVDVARTKGRRYVAIHASSKTSNEIRLVGGGKGNEDGVSEPVLVKDRAEGVQYFVECGADEDDLVVMAHRSDSIVAAAAAEESTTADGGIGEEMTLFRASVSDLPLPPDGSFGAPLHRHRSTSAACSSSSDAHQFILEEIDLFSKYLAVYERSSIDGRQRIRVLDRRRPGEGAVVPIPEGIGGSCATIAPGGNIWFDSTRLRFSVESPVTPAATYEYDMDTGTVKTMLHSTHQPGTEAEKERDAGAIERAAEIESVADPIAEYVHKRVLISSADGTKVPMTLVYKNLRPNPNDDSEEEVASLDDDARQDDARWDDLDPPLRALLHDPSRPAVLIGYGAYGQPVDMSYDPLLAVPLVERGAILAYSNTRGGGELGRSWYRAGRLYEKERAVEDYLACAEALAFANDSDGSDITSIAGASAMEDDDSGGRRRRRRPVVARAFSAGGVVVGAALNRRPELFAAASLTNAFLDVTGSMTDPSLPLTEHERDEWGDPMNDSEAAKCIARYCPVVNANASKGTRPPVLCVGTLDDENVPCWHASTYVGRLREAEKNALGEAGGTTALLHVEERGGHHLHGRRLDVAALEVSFLLGRLFEGGSSSASSNGDDDGIGIGKDAPSGEDAPSIFGPIWRYLRDLRVAN